MLDKSVPRVYNAIINLFQFNTINKNNYVSLGGYYRKTMQ